MNREIRKNGLSGKHIVLDPGHFGGALSEVEERYVRANLDGTRIHFDEGTLTVATARILKTKLEKAGARVTITKNVVGRGVLDQGFYDWQASPEFEKSVDMKVANIEDPKERAHAKRWWMSEATDVEKFRLLFNVMDIEKRAEIITSLKPDFTLFLHFNSGADRDPISGDNLLTEDNYSVIFVGGAYVQGELESKEARRNFVRQLFTSEVFESKIASSYLVEALEKDLGISPVSEYHEYAQEGYLKKYSLKLSDGVYARNMTLTRRVPGVIAYAEPLCQDNVHMINLLAQRGLQVGDLITSPYLLKVATAYYKGIEKYFGHPAAEEEPR